MFVGRFHEGKNTDRDFMSGKTEREREGERERERELSLIHI